MAIDVVGKFCWPIHIHLFLTLVLSIIPAEGDQDGSHPKADEIKNRLIFFLVAVFIFLEKNITAFLIVESFIDGYILTESTDAIVTLLLLILATSE